MGDDNLQDAQVAAGVTTGIATGVAGAATAGTALASAAAAATLIGGIVVGALLLIKTFRGTTHLYANEMVQGLENPFGKSIGAIVDAKDAAINGGYATKRLILDARAGVAQLWNEYQFAAAEYAATGPQQATVARQSLENLNGPTGMGGRFPEGFINRLLGDMDRQASAIPLSLGGILGTTDKKVVVGVVGLGLLVMLLLLAFLARLSSR